MEIDINKCFVIKETILNSKGIKDKIIGFFDSSDDAVKYIVSLYKVENIKEVTWNLETQTFSGKSHHFQIFEIESKEIRFFEENGKE